MTALSATRCAATEFRSGWRNGWRSRSSLSKQSRSCCPSSCAHCRRRPSTPRLLLRLKPEVRLAQCLAEAAGSFQQPLCTPAQLAVVPAMLQGWCVSVGVRENRLQNIVITLDKVLYTAPHEVAGPFFCYSSHSHRA